MSDAYLHNWPTEKLADLCEINIGGTPSRNVPAFWAKPPDGHAWLSIADIKQKYLIETTEHITDLGARSSNVKAIAPDTMVMSFKLSVGKAGIVKKPMYCNEAIAIFQPLRGRVDHRWLYFALPRAAATAVTDTAVKGATFNKASLAKLALSVPDVPLQSKIADVLDTMDAAIRGTEAVVAKLKAMKQGLLHDLLTRGIDANGDLRPPQSEAPLLYKQTPLGWLPTEWEELSLDEITGTSICYGIVQVFGYVDDGVPVLAIRDLLGDYRSNIHRTAKHVDARYPRSRVQPGDVLLSIKGTIGRVGVVPEHFEGNISRDIGLLRPNHRVVSGYLALLLRSPLGQRLLSDTQVGTTRAELSIGPLKRLLVPVPPLREQVRIADPIDGFEQKLADEASLLEKLRLQKLGLMDDLLTGRVPVTPLL